MSAAPPRRSARLRPALEATAPTLPFRLDRARGAFLVVSGAVDVFARTAGGPRRPLLRAEAGEAVFALAASADVEVVALGAPGTQLRALDPADARPFAEAWRRRLCERLGVEGDGDLQAGLGDWLRRLAEADRERLQKRLEGRALRARGLLQGLGRLAGSASAPADRRDREPAGSPLLAACDAIARALGLEGVPQPAAAATCDDDDGVREIVRAAGLRMRRTVLRPGWLHHDVGPLLAWIDETRAPVALLPTARGYELFDPASGTRTALDQAMAGRLSGEAVAFYRPLPTGPLDLSALLRWFAPLARGELRRMLLAALGVALVGLAAPLVTGVVIDQAILPSDGGVLLACALALVAAAIGAAGFVAMQSIAVLRLGAAAEAALQSAIVDHLLKLPAQFFKGYSAGDLVDRLYGAEALRRVFAGRVVGGLLAGLFCVFGFGLMFVLDARLAVVAVLLGAVQLGATLGLSHRRLRYERGYARASGQARGLVLQILGGVAKLRAAAAESRAFGQWLERFSAQVGQFVRGRRAASALAAFNASFPIFATLVIFALAPPAGAAGSGRFLAFFAAFGQALATLVALGGALSELISAAPHVERLWPVLTAQTEAERTGGDAIVLSGALELKDVTFAYGPGARPALDGLSLHVRSGEFVALVGPSGAGKSTLLRLLLGFEQPQAGDVLYDGRPIRSLDLTGLRRQIGVVLQDGRLISGSLYENICGTAVVPLEDVWEAVRRAGLAADVEALPMGLHTVVTEGANTLSGGQRQRLLIARALLRRPRLLLFDEATSALDNPTQAIVSAALAELAVTRIVIAHRLSTVRDADRILVIDGGAVVQEGTFDLLSRQPGLFAELARRQLV